MRPLLDPQVHWFCKEEVVKLHISDDRYAVLTGFDAQTLIRKLLPFLDGSSTCEAIAVALGETTAKVSAAVGFLKAHGFVVDAEGTTFSQKAASLMLAREVGMSLEAAARLEEAHVTLIAPECVRDLIGTHLRPFVRFIEILSSVPVPDAPVRSDLVLLIPDRYATTVCRQFNHAALHQGFTWLPAFRSGLRTVQVGPSFCAGLGGACFECADTRRRTNWLQDPEGRADLRHYLEDTSVGGFADISAHATSFVAGVVTREAVLLAAGMPHRARTVGQIMDVDIGRLDIDPHVVLRVPGCRACGARRPSEQPW